MKRRPPRKNHGGITDEQVLIAASLGIVGRNERETDDVVSSDGVE